MSQASSPGFFCANYHTTLFCCGQRDRHNNDASERTGGRCQTKIIELPQVVWGRTRAADLSASNHGGFRHGVRG